MFLRIPGLQSACSHIPGTRSVSVERDSIERTRCRSISVYRYVSMWYNGMIQVHYRIDSRPALRHVSIHVRPRAASVNIPARGRARSPHSLTASRSWALRSICVGPVLILPSLGGDNSTPTLLKVRRNRSGRNIWANHATGVLLSPSSRRA